MSESIRALLFGLVFGANIGLILSNLSLRKKLRERISLFDRFNAELQEVLLKENEFLKRIKEKYNDNRNNDNSSSSC